jgi:hypothetical protein
VTGHDLVVNVVTDVPVLGWKAAQEVFLRGHWPAVEEVQLLVPLVRWAAAQRTRVSLTLSVLEARYLPLHCKLQDQYPAMFHPESQQCKVQGSWEPCMHIWR